MRCYLHFVENCFSLICQLIVVNLFMRLEICTELNIFLFFAPQNVSFYLKCFYEIVVEAWKSCFFQPFILSKVVKFHLVSLTYFKCISTFKLFL